jgi:hypothetical protein
LLDTKIRTRTASPLAAQTTDCVGQARVVNHVQPQMHASQRRLIGYGFFRRVRSAACNVQADCDRRGQSMSRSP